MKFIIVLCCVLAVASAQYGQQRYNGPYHIPVIGPNGVPQEPPEVVAERNKHLAAFNSVPQQQPQYQPQYQSQPQPQWQGQQYQPQQNYNQGPTYPRYQGPLAKVGPDGMPQYDPAVAQARAAHQAAYAEVNSRNAQLHSQISAQSRPWGK